MCTTRCHCPLPGDCYENYRETVKFVAEVLEVMEQRLDKLIAQLDS